MRSTFRLATSAALMVVIVALLLTLATAKPAEAKVARFWVASIMHLANLTPNTAHSNDVDPAVSPDGRYVAFASDRDGDFEIYTANVFTGEVERLTNNTVYDYNPGWSFDGTMITYDEPLSSPEEVRIFSLRMTHEVPLSSI
jgi:dipeptidyl aminopeptidase/acylaminoacyl peptidase